MTLALGSYVPIFVSTFCRSLRSLNRLMQSHHRAVRTAASGLRTTTTRLTQSVAAVPKGPKWTVGQTIRREPIAPLIRQAPKVQTAQKTNACWFNEQGTYDVVWSLSDRFNTTLAAKIMELFSREDEGWYRLNSQLSLLIVLREQSVLFWRFINVTAYHLGRYEPSSPSTKEIHAKIDHSCQ